MSGKRKISGWLGDRRGNVAIMFALTSPVLLLAAGIAIDYSMYSRQQARLAMLADEAALAAVSNAAMQQTIDQSTTMAQNMFVAQASALPMVTLDANQPVVSIVPDASGLKRTATVTYSAKYSTLFSNFLNVPQLNASGKAVAETAVAANIDFYLLLDNQGSMALPATQSGIAQMQGLTQMQNGGGCAFACHEAAPMSPPAPWGVDTQGNLCSPDGHNPPYSAPTLQGQDYSGITQNNVWCDTTQSVSQIDNYQLARNNGIPLRFDQVVSATSNLMSSAETIQSLSNPQPTYRFAVYSVDAPYTQGLYSVMPLTSDFVSGWGASSANLQLYEVYSDGAACAPSGGNPCGAGVSTGAYNAYSQLVFQNVGFFSSPMGTEMQTLASTIPNPGSGGAGAQPQEVLFIVTDGVEDTVNGAALSITAWDSNALAACSALKAKGVRIAILYTTYYPTPGFSLYDNFVAGFQSNIGPTLQSCASANLFMTAQIGDNISQDMLTLFQIAAQSPKLTQ